MKPGGDQCEEPLMDLHEHDPPLCQHVLYWCECDLSKLCLLVPGALVLANN